ncbi:MAG: hypothetical protein RI560_08020 [Natronomonas sp.]|nr:hypothetical protein [Natronomonas sp.]
MVPHRPLSGAVSRRDLIATGTGLLAGGGLAIAAGSGRAGASVTTTDLDIPDAAYSGEDDTVARLDLTVSGAYEYATNDADELWLALEVAPEATDSPDFATIDEQSESISTASGAGQYNLAGDLLDHPALDASEFNADPEETITREVPIRVVLQVRLGGEAVVEAISETVVDVTVTNETVKATAAVMGEGELTIEM